MKKAMIVIFVLLALLVGYGIYCNKALEINAYVIESEKIPVAFHEFRIAHVSDLHNAEFGTENEKLLALLKSADADIIVITGDMVDSRKTDVDVALSFAEKAAAISPVYYVNGNHESRIAEYERLKEGLLQCGVTVLENDVTDLMVGDDCITLIGLKDPAFPMDRYVDDTMEQNVSYQLLSVLPDTANYKILLAHRPEYFECYVDHVDLVFSGHAHGGQFILPFFGGLIAPNQGLFPAFYEGVYTENGTSMIVSRGIGNSLFPLRIHNPPEIVVVELKCKK